MHILGLDGRAYHVTSLELFGSITADLSPARSLLNYSILVKTKKTNEDICGFVILKQYPMVEVEIIGADLHLNKHC